MAKYKVGWTTYNEDYDTVEADSDDEAADMIYDQERHYGTIEIDFVEEINDDE